MYLGLMRFPCSVNELLRMRSYIDISMYIKRHVYMGGSFLHAYRDAFVLH